MSGRLVLTKSKSFHKQLIPTPINESEIFGDHRRMGLVHFGGGGGHTHFCPNHKYIHARMPTYPSIGVGVHEILQVTPDKTKQNTKKVMPWSLPEYYPNLPEYCPNLPEHCPNLPEFCPNIARIRYIGSFFLGGGGGEWPPPAPVSYAYVGNTDFKTTKTREHWPLLASKSFMFAHGVNRFEKISIKVIKVIFQKYWFEHICSISRLERTWL